MGNLDRPPSSSPPAPWRRRSAKAPSFTPFSRIAAAAARAASRPAGSCGAALPAGNTAIRYGSASRPSAECAPARNSVRPLSDSQSGQKPAPLSFGAAAATSGRLPAKTSSAMPSCGDGRISRTAAPQRFPQADGEPFARIFGFAVVCHRRTSYFFLYSSARPRLPSGSKWPVRSSRLTVIPAIIGVTRAAAANSAAVKTGGSDSGRNRP